MALPPGMALDTGAHKIDIAIDGATIDGKVFPVAYSTQSVDPASPQFAVPRFAARPVVRPAKGRNRSLRAGMKVRVVVTVTNAQKVSYRWRRGRTPIRGAAGRTYVIKRADRGIAERPGHRAQRDRRAGGPDVGEPPRRAPLTGR